MRISDWSSDVCSSDLILRISGAELREVPAVPYKDPGNYVHVSERLARELSESHPQGAIWARQFDNVSNLRGHYETTGTENWDQTDGNIDRFARDVGTHGTPAGTARSAAHKSDHQKPMSIQPALFC